jgi:predicted nicotinamide N-methyase
VSEREFRGYGIIRERVPVGGRWLELDRPTDMDALLERPEVQKRFEEDSYLPYWAEIWPAGVLLAERVMAEPVKGDGRMLEIGCGLGLVGIAAATSGWRVTATDYDADALAFAEQNAALNGVRLEGVKILDIREPFEGDGYERIVGADMLYEQRLCPQVAHWLAGALAAGGQAWLSDPNRAAAEGFTQAARSAGLRATVESGQMRRMDGKVIGGRIWRVEYI